MWMLIAAVGAGVFIYQFLTELLKGRYSILETRLNEIAGIGETSQKQVKRWESSLMSRMGKAALERLSSTVGTVLPVSRREKQRISFLMARAGLRIQPGRIHGSADSVFDWRCGTGHVFRFLCLIKGYPVFSCSGSVCRLHRVPAFFRQKMRRRQNSILEQLPELLDCLVSVWRQVSASTRRFSILRNSVRPACG